MPWITAPELKQRLADVLSKGVSDLDPKWDSIVGDAVISASNTVTELVTARGFSVTQVAAWDQVKDFTKDIGIYWCLIRGGALGNYSDQFVKAFDRRDELRKLEAIIIGGVPTTPGIPTATDLAVGSGRLAGDATNGRFPKWPSDVY